MVETKNISAGGIWDTTKKGAHDSGEKAIPLPPKKDDSKIVLYLLGAVLIYFLFIK